MEIVEQIEEWSWECIMEFFNVVQEYGYFYDVRNIAIGDSTSFFKKEGTGEIEHFVPTRTHTIEIRGVFTDKIDSIEKRYIREILICELNKVLIEETKGRAIGGIPFSKKKVKVAFDYVHVKKMPDEMGYNLFIPLGIVMTQ